MEETHQESVLTKKQVYRRGCRSKKRINFHNEGRRGELILFTEILQFAGDSLARVALSIPNEDEGR